MITPHTCGSASSSKTKYEKRNLCSAEKSSVIRADSHSKFWPNSLTEPSGPTSNKLVVVVVLGNVHTFKYGVIWK